MLAFERRFEGSRVRRASNPGTSSREIRLIGPDDRREPADPSSTWTHGRHAIDRSGATKERKEFGRHTTEDCSIHRFRQHRDRRQEHARHAVRHRRRARGAQGARRRRLEDRLRRLDARRRLQPVAHPARDQAGAAQPHARRRQERRGHQPGARRARDGLHPHPHQRLRDRRRRQRLHHAGREAEAVRQADLRGRRPRVHQRGDAAQLPRVHRLREPGRLAAGAGSRPSDRAGRGGAGARSSRSCRSCGAR